MDSKDTTGDGSVGGGPEVQRTRPQVLDFPSKIALTSAGATFFASRRRALHRYESADGSVRYGFRFPRTDLRLLKRLIWSGFLDKAEFRVSDVGSQKDGLSDLSRLLVFSMLRLRLERLGATVARGSSLVARWNRANPQRPLTEALAGGRLAAALQKSKAAVDAARREILDPVRARIRADPVLEERERDRLGYFAEEAVSALQPLTWFVLAGTGGAERRPLLSKVSQALSSAVEAADLADYSSLMTVELLSAEERNSLVRRLGAGVGKAAALTLLDHPDKRRAVFEDSGGGRGSVFVAAIKRSSDPEEGRDRLRLSFYDDAADFDYSIRLLEDFSSPALIRGGGGRRLSELLSSREGAFAEDGLCYYYLSLLEDACMRRSVHFDAALRESDKDGSVVTTLRYSF